MSAGQTNSSQTDGESEIATQPESPNNLELANTPIESERNRSIMDEVVPPAIPVVTTPRAGSESAKRIVGSLVPALLGILTVIVVWELVGVFSDLMPPPTDTVSYASDLVRSGQFFGDMAASLRRVLVAFGAGMVVSVAIGILMGTSRFAERFFEPLIILGLTIPGLIWALIVIMLLGLSELTDYVAVFVAIVPMLVVNIWGGVKGLDKELIDMAHVIGLGVKDKVFHIILPQLMPHIFAASRYGLGLAWKVVVVLELYGATSGVGYQINQDYQKFDLTGVLAWTLLFVIVMLILEKAIIGLLERRMTAWQPRANVWRR